MTPVRWSICRLTLLVANDSGRQKLEPETRSLFSPEPGRTFFARVISGAQQAAQAIKALTSRQYSYLTSRFSLEGL
jgi:hypothetical protein